MKLIKIQKILNKTDLGLSGKNGTEILIDTNIKPYFENIKKNEEVSFLNLKTNEPFPLTKKIETSQKFTNKTLQKSFTDLKLEEGDIVEFYIFEKDIETSYYYINFIHTDFLIFKKKGDEYYSQSESKLNKNFNKIKTYVKQTELKKLRTDAKVETQFYKIETNFDLFSMHKINYFLKEIKVSTIEIIEFLSSNYNIDEPLTKIQLDSLFSSCNNIEIEYHINELDIIERSNQTIKVKPKVEVVPLNENSYINFLKNLNFEEDLKPKNITNNILFNIGQPNTGKSYKFEESNLFDKKDIGKYKYLKIPVSGGIGNEYKGLQNTDLAITYDPIKEELRFGEFLQMLMSAIINPKVPHIVFLDDFHNQDISSLLSEYTPLFKGQQKRNIKDIDISNAVYKDNFNDADAFIKQWNKFIENHCVDIPIVPITNRISGDSLKLVYPSNFYLLGAANFNENSLNIFADWEDRATISYLNPIKSFDEDFIIKDEETEDNKAFLECCKELNKNLKELLEYEDRKIFDYEKYCFGMWKIVNSEGNIISDQEEQTKIINFFFGMIKNSLKYNNKNSEINHIGWELIKAMQDDEWFKINVEDIKNKTEINYKILHKHNIYEDEI